MKISNIKLNDLAGEVVATFDVVVEGGAVENMQAKFSRINASFPTAIRQDGSVWPLSCLEAAPVLMAFKAANNGFIVKAYTRGGNVLFYTGGAGARWLDDNELNACIFGRGEAGRMVESFNRQYKEAGILFAAEVVHLAARVTPENTQAAHAAGYQAAASNAPRGPAACPVYMALIDGFGVGEGASELAKIWLQGYRAQCDAVAAAILAND